MELVLGLITGESLHFWLGRCGVAVCFYALVFASEARQSYKQDLLVLLVIATWVYEYEWEIYYDYDIKNSNQSFHGSVS